jgi:hypothetical protein
VKVPDIDSRTLQSAIYSLVACGLASTPTCGRIPTPPQVARLGTDSHVQTPSVSRLGTPHYPEGIAIARLGTKQPAKPAVFTIGNAGALSPSRVTPMPFRTPLPPGVPALPTVPRTKTNPELAGEAAERAKRALAQDKPEAAVLELKKAVELVPNDPDYTALLGWALFCAADDKRAAATIARKALESAIAKSRQPQIARFYLGRIERILGHNEEALGHFHAVLLMQPDHREASAEIRVLQARLKRS